ncbi:response regulator transcription factor [Patulibacter defluvii]|uniref:response regulator transcription factor n=1 Tax=Patulibacter defluvii TaxID=3095358 RepID=UPI002A7622ED|nr:response regulator transcription factor [Patulibacter sp. DM4]
MATATRPSAAPASAPAIVDDAVRSIVAELDAEAAFGGLADARGQVPLLHSCGVEPERFAALVLRTGRGLGGRVLGESRAFALSDYQRARSITREYMAAITDEGLRGMACVPIPGEDGVGGLLYVASRERGAPGDRLVRAVERVAVVAAARIRERGAHEQEQRRILDHQRRTMAGAVQDAVSRQLLFIGQAARHAEISGDPTLALRGIRRAADAAQRGLRDLWAPAADRATGSLRVLLVDGHPLIRRGLRATVEDALGAAVIDEAATIDEALELARRAAPDLVLLDPGAPGDLPAAFACAELRALRPTTRIALLTSELPAAELRACLDAGACSCLRPDGDPQRLADGLRRTLDGEPVRDALPAVADAPAAAAAGPHLTPRERQVLTLLAEGCSNRQIAERLVLSEPTVKGHVGRLLAKLGARSRLQVVVRAAELGLR